MSRSDTTHTWRCFWTSKQKLLHEIQVVLITASSVSGSLWFICLLVSFPEGSTRSEFRRDLYEHDHLQQQRWKEPPGETSADLHPHVTGSLSSKPATRRLKAMLSQGLHYGTFVKRRFTFVWRERKKKNQVLLGKAGVVLSTSVKAPSITLLPLRATDALKTQEL